MKRSYASASLYRLIYYSRNVLAASETPAAMAAELEAIADAARQRNASNGVTSCLMCSASAFAQVLEGSRDAVERTFDRIDADRRHADVMTISLTPIVQLSFPGRPFILAWQADRAGPDPLSYLIADAGTEHARAITGTDMLRLLRLAADAPAAMPAV